MHRVRVVWQGGRVWLSHSTAAGMKFLSCITQNMTYLHLACTSTHTHAETGSSLPVSQEDDIHIDYNPLCH